MPSNAFHKELAGILGIAVGDLRPDLVLAEHTWDSMAVVSTILAIDEVLDLTVEAEALGRCATVAEIEALIARMRGQ